MKKYSLKNVIVPFDFSDSSKEALRAALEIVDTNENIKVIHVMPNLTTTETMIVLSEMNESLIAENVKKKFAEACKEEGFPELNFHAVFGDAGSEITSYAKESDAGLIVISSHGRTGLDRILLGSVAERVVRLAPCPVLVLRADGS